MDGNREIGKLNVDKNKLNAYKDKLKKRKLRPETAAGRGKSESRSRKESCNIRHASGSVKKRSFLRKRTVPANFEQLANSPKISPPAGVPRGMKRARASEEEIWEIKNSAKNIYLVKTIHFKDGSDYQIPEEIATSVYDNPSCTP
ncbi:MAG: hypothetical protein WAL59_02460 [Roseiarcus sp.]